MKRIFALLLILGSTALAEKIRVEFRLKSDPYSTVHGWILSYNDDGFRFEYLRPRRRGDVRWSDLVEDDARGLRQKFKLELTEEERLGLIDGHVIFFKGGNSVRGVLLGIDEDGTHRMRHEGLVLPYPAERIDRVDEIKVKENEAYSPEEIYVRRLERTPPRTAVDHRRLADYFFDIGNWDAATIQYESAIGKNPLLRTELEPRLAELRDYMQDKAASIVFRKAMKEARLDGRWAKAIEDIETYISEHSGAKRRGARLVEELQEKWLEKKTATFHRVKNEEFDRSIRRYLVRRQPEIAEARSWVTSQLQEELKGRVEKRLDLKEGEYEMFLEAKRKKTGAPHWATYWSGSFVINSRVKLGKSTKKAIRGDPDKWWGNYDQINVRAGWLKAYATERLPELFEVVYVRTTDCEKCGGKGQVKHMSIIALESTGHEWWQVCPRCYGAKQDRSVAYR